jgi:phosphatidylethanolamine/phosphatidyl-N-methylethanolamine N-methyltransferase
MRTLDLVKRTVEAAYASHRVVKPGGRFILVNHLYSQVGVAAAVERWVARRTRNLGLRPEFRLARLQAWAPHNKDAILVRRRKAAPFGVHTLVCFERTATLLAV